MLRCPGCGEENPPKFRLCGYCGTPLAGAAPPPAALPAHEVRKTVTIVFCDLKGSTALGEHLDPEALHEVKERYFAIMAAEIARHGGKVEKYIGDAIMAVFGLPRAHEDDALRAVRAAAGMQAALAALNTALAARYGVTLANRTGVNTGEVVANDDPGADQKLATGDAVNVAARLEQAAGDNQILLGELTFGLVRDAVEVEAVPPLDLKGKAQPVKAFRLLAATGQDGHVRRHDKPIVGRDAELARLRAVYADVSARRVAQLVTVVGDAGAGKSRLVREVLERIAVGAHNLSGRCLPYGEGITFWPLTMMVREAAGIREDDSPEAARARLASAMPDAQVAERLACAAGLSAVTFPLPEINWAARKFLQHLASDRPLVALVDDIHWAEPAFLDLLQYVLQTAEDAPILLLATARHELLDERPDWGSQPGMSQIVLQRLSDEASAQVVANLLDAAELPADVTMRIVRAAGGNPLYAEQLLSMLIDQGTLIQVNGRWQGRGDAAAIEVPPTIHALLEARLDALGRAERATVEPASVIGLEFRPSAVEWLAPEALRPQLPQHLDALARKQFILPQSAAGADALYRFHHHLVRETVYNGLLKRTRAQLHLAFVRWADRVNADRDRAREFEEILGYHLEQAHRYLGELGPLDDEGHAVGRDASRRLAAAGRRAMARGDVHAAASLLRRAAALRPADDADRLGLLPELAEALIGLGDFTGAHHVLDEAQAGAARGSLPRVHAASVLTTRLVNLYSGEAPAGWGDDALATAHALVPGLEALGADQELAMAWRLVTVVHATAGRYGLVGEAVTRSIEHARRAGNERMVVRNALILAGTAVNGPMPVDEAIRHCESLLAQGLTDLPMQCNLQCALAQLHAMNGDLAAARELVLQSRHRLRDLGQGVYAASTGIDLARVELLGGDLALAERELRQDHAFLAAKGETYFLSTLGALLARIVREQGRDDEALDLSRTAERAAADDDVESQALWRMVRAPILMRLGQGAQASDLAAEAVELALRTEMPLLQADALAEQAEVLHLAGGTDQAQAAARQAAGLYAAKRHRQGVVRMARWSDGVTGRS